MTKQFNITPDKVATIVVHPTAGVGDATTIADGIAMLAQLSAGGNLLLREGTYSPTTTVTLPVGKPITITGCGAATIIDLGANAICAFSIPDGYTINTPINFCDFHVTGTEVADQGVVACNDTLSFSEVYLTRVDTVGVEQFVRVNTGAFDGTAEQDDLKIHITQCRIRPISTDTSIIIKNTFGGFVNIRTWIKEVQFEGDNIFALETGTFPRTEPLWGTIVDDNYFGDIYADGCEFSLGGTTENDFGIIQAVNCQFMNNDPDQPFIQYQTFGSTAGYMPSNLQGCSLHRIKIQASDAITYNDCQIDACSLVFFGFGSTIHGCQFLSTVSPYPTDLSGNPFVIETFDSGLKIIGNIFYAFDANPVAESGTDATIIEIFAETTIIGNDLSNMSPPPVVGLIEVFNSSCVFVGNRFPFAPTAGPPMKDWSGSNYYYGNSQLFWRTTGSIIGPAGDGFAEGKGLGNVIEGTRSFNGSGSVGGTATNSIIVDYRNSMGLTMTKGYMKNTGANNITVREQYITQDEGTFTRSTVVGAGVTQTLDPFDFTGLGAIDYQVTRYTVDVSGTTIAWRVNFAAPGGLYQY
jgi:hypothetical protein